MPIATEFKPEYIEHNGLSAETLSRSIGPALDEVGCSEKQVDLKAHRILAKAVCGDYRILCWWAAQQEEVIADGKPMLTIDKGDSTLLGICAVPGNGKTGDTDAIARLNTRIKEKIEHYISAARA